MTSRARLFANLINSTSAITVPVGTDAQRPETPTSGSLRYSTTSSSLEIYNGTAWVGVGGGGASVTSTSTAPVSPTNGDMWHNTTNNKLYVYYNAEWTAMKSGSIVSTNDVFTGNGSQVNFTLSSAPTNEDHTLVAVGGVVQEKSTYSISGSTLTLSEAPISGDSIEVMIFNAGVEESATATPKISNIQVTDSGGTVLDDTAVDIAGGYIKITGTGFASGCQVIVNNVPATSTTFVSSTVVRAQLPATAAGTYIVYLINSDGGVGIRVNGVTFSASPGWQTSSSLSGNIDDAISIQLIATGATVFALQAGSTLPTGLTLSSGGLISGTVTGLAEETIYSFTVTASDAENQESPRTFSITITVGDAYFNRTVLAINADVGNTFASDASSNNFAITVAGDTKPVTFSPYNTNWSNYFDGTGDYLSFAPGSAFAFGTGDFTVECLVYPTTTLAGTTSLYIIDARNSGQTSTWAFLTNGNGSVSPMRLDWYTGSAVIAGSSNLIANIWNHCVYTRSGSTYGLFLNGSRVATGTDSTNYSVSPSTSYIGSRFSAENLLTGYISNIRIVKGTAVYDPTQTTITIPTSPLTAIANTSLLTCQSNRLIDNSTNAFAITKNGDTKVSPFGPFTETDTTTGSGYFDGTGDYLSLASNDAFNMGTGDFTLECYYYHVSGSSALYPSIFSSTDWSGGGVSLRFNNTGQTNKFAFFWNGVGDPWLSSSSTYTPFQWNHVALTRSGNTFTLWVNGQSAATNTNSGSINFNYNGGGPRIGWGPWDGNNGYVSGIISSLRVVKGTAVYTSAFTPPSSPLTAVANTSLLTLQTRQPVNNHSFIDASRNNLLVTKVGNASQGSFSPFSPAGWSAYFDGTGDYLSVPNNAAFDLASGNFTIECWVYPTTWNATAVGIFGKRSSTAIANQIGLEFSGSGGTIRFAYNSSGSEIIVSGAAGTLNAWQHIAVVRNGSTLTIYKDGVSTGTATINVSITTNNDALAIGVVSSNGSFPITGYITNFRIVKGTAVYTTNFTPPTSSLTAIANTSLLTCQSNRFIDNSTNNFAVTINGDAAVVNFSPFKPTANYSRTTHGGSVYFDGSGDSVDLTLADSNIAIVGNRVGTTQFVWTIEAWVYPLSNIFTIIQRASNSVGDLEWYWYQDSTNGLMWHHRQYGTNDRLVYANIVLKQKQWHHIVQQKEDNSTWVFYVNGVKCNTTYGAGGSPNAYGDVNLVNGNLTKIGASTTGPAGAFYMSDFMFTRNIRYSGNNITLPTSPTTANSYTSLLLNYNNAGIVDTTSRNVIETVGDSRIVTTTKKFGTGSMYFDGTGDYLTSSATPNLDMGTGDWTVEGWVYVVTRNSSYPLIIGNYNGGGFTAGALALTVSNADNASYNDRFVLAAYDLGGTRLLVANTTNNFNTWYHFAVVRNGTNLTIYRNGISLATTTISAAFTFDWGKLGLRIGGGNWDGINGTYNGYIDDLRITKGYARYTANFTPPSSTFMVR